LTAPCHPLILAQHNGDVSPQSSIAWFSIITYLTQLIGQHGLGYNDKLTKTHNKVKTTWNIIRAETGKQGKNEESIKPGKINPNAFHHYFLTTTENNTHNISTRTTHNNRNYKYYLESPFPKTRFNNITSKETEKVISSLHPKNSYGYDEILTVILKLTAPHISSPLCYIFIY
jgi:hypothetical protein